MSAAQAALKCGDSLELSVDADGIATLRMDVPGRSMNLVTIAFGRQLSAAVERIAADPAIRGVVLSSGKADFMAGGDIHGMVANFDKLGDAATVYREIARPVSELLRRMETCGKPFVAAINGSALGGGFELALACHYRVVADLPRLILALPEVTIGLIPGAGGSQRLPRLIGIEAALPLLLKGTRLSPAAALKLGAVDAVVPAEQLLDAAKTWLLQTGNQQQPWDQKNYRIPGGAGFFDARITRQYNAGATALTVGNQHNLPSQIALLSAVARGTAVPIDAGLRIEAREFTRLIRSPVSRNLMRTQFVSKGECDKLAHRPAGIEAANLGVIGVIGAGLMGAGIAQVCAAAGLEVVMLDATLERAEAGKQRIADAFGKRIAKGTLDAAKSAAALARITLADAYQALAHCDLVVEAVFEDRAVKAEVFRKLAAVLKPTAIIASNTSALPIQQLAASVAQPAQFVGLHFFSPVDRMPLVEVISGAQTSARTLAHALDFIKRLRKTPILVKDAPGFFTTRVIIAHLFESVGMVGDGISPVLIDNLARQAGFAIGPLALMDDLTLDLTYHAHCKRRDEAGSAWREPYGFPVFENFVMRLDRKGRRYGAGFYDYVDGKRQPWSGLAQIYPADGTHTQPTHDDIKQRLLYIQALEAARAYEEGVITSAGEGDVGSVLGIGFPAHTGGVFSLIDTVGVAEFVAACECLADRYGERFRPSAWLKARAQAGQRFYPAAA
ncbi:MAG: fadJ [Nevskia sp.]|nr:fadJ [Nevskia sp.]